MIGPLNGQPHGSFDNYRLGRKNRHSRDEGVSRTSPNNTRMVWKDCQKDTGYFLYYFGRVGIFVLSWKLWAFFIFLPYIYLFLLAVVSDQGHRLESVQPFLHVGRAHSGQPFWTCLLCVVLTS